MCSTGYIYPVEHTYPVDNKLYPVDNMIFFVLYRIIIVVHRISPTGHVLVFSKDF